LAPTKINHLATSSFADMKTQLNFQDFSCRVKVSLTSVHLANIQMRKINKKISLTYFGFLVYCLCFLGCAATPATITDKSGDSDLAGLLESIRIKERLPALAAAIIIDGKIYATAAVGTRKAKTNNWVSVDDKFLIASCSKAFTATLSAVLIQKGYLQWDTTLKETFPDLDMRSEYEDITLIQLLSHRAGLPEWIDHLTSKNVTAQFIDNWWNDQQSPVTMRTKYVKDTVKQRLADKPGHSIFYSNSGYLMAGAMLEKIMEKPFEQLMTEEIFRPMGLQTAGFGTPVKSDPQHQPIGHSGFFRSPHPKDFPEYMAPTAVIRLSIIDWARFILLHLGSGENEGVVLDTDSLRTLHSPPDTATWRANSEEKGYGIPSLNYALGWYTLNIDNKEGLLWHPGGNSGFIAQVVVDPKRKNAVLLATNVRASHNHLFNAINRIKAHYSPEADLPGIE
jgi:CubicO group peptidase (beta-lactamase class C family)